MKISAKVGRGDLHQSELLRRLREEGYDSDIELPFTHEEVSCWLVRSAAWQLSASELLSAIKVCVVLASL